MSTEAVLCERRGGGLWLRLNRPHALDALNTDVADGLNRGLDLAEADEVPAGRPSGCPGGSEWPGPSS